MLFEMPDSPVAEDWGFYRKSCRGYLSKEDVNPEKKVYSPLRRVK
jgi:hypothetical protein